MGRTLVLHRMPLVEAVYKASSEQGIYETMLTNRLISDDGNTKFVVVDSIKGPAAAIYAQAITAIQEVREQERNDARRIEEFYKKLAGHAFAHYIYKNISSHVSKSILLQEIKDKFVEYKTNPHSTAKEVVDDLKTVVFGPHRVPIKDEGEIKNEARMLYEVFLRENNLTTGRYTATNYNSLILKDEYKDKFEQTFSSLTDPAQTDPGSDRMVSRLPNDSQGLKLFK